MPTLLRIDSSPMAAGASFSRQLTDEFVSEWLRVHPDGKVIVRDLPASHLELIDAEWIAASRSPEASLTPRQKELLALSDQLIGELKDADEYVIGVSMHNLSIPSSLRLWVDLVARTGKTFGYENGAPVGLLKGKAATFLVATGGVYDQGTPRAALNHAEPYLRTLFNFLGVNDVRFIRASGTARAMHGVDRSAILQPALENIHTQLHTV